MRRWDQLNDGQLAVLKLVAAGSTLGPNQPNGQRTARALQDRGLLDISRRGSNWQATITDAGVFYIEHGCHPDHPNAPKAASKNP